MDRIILATAMCILAGSAHAQNMQGRNNLSDLANTAIARSNLGVVNAATITPLTTTIGTTPTTIWSAAPFLSIRITLPSAVLTTCTTDGSTPTLGGANSNVQQTASFVGQQIFSPIQPGGATPSGAVKCIAATSTSFAASGSITYLEAH